MSAAIITTAVFSSFAASQVSAGDTYIAPYVSAGLLNHGEIDETYLLPEFGVVVGHFINDQISVELLYTLESSASNDDEKAPTGDSLVAEDEVSRQIISLSGQYYIDLGEVDGFISAGLANMDMEATRTLYTPATGEYTQVSYFDKTNTMVLEAGALFNGRHRPSFVLNMPYDSNQDYGYFGFAYRYLFRF